MVSLVSPVTEPVEDVEDVEDFSKAYKEIYDALNKGLRLEIGVISVFLQRLNY